MKPDDFIASLVGLRFLDVFNPYVDRCPVHDVEDAPARRTRTFLELLNRAARTEIDSLWIGRDLGYRGGRRTGLALTDDVHLTAHTSRWDVSAKRATAGAMMAERTAAVIWKVLAAVSVPIFLWNVFPYHPHETDRPFTNRAHTARERMAGEELLADLISLLKPRRLVAI